MKETSGVDLAVMTLFGLVVFACACLDLYGMSFISHLEDDFFNLGLKASSMTETTNGSRLAITSNVIVLFAVSLLMIMPALSKLYGCCWTDSKPNFF